MVAFVFFARGWIGGGDAKLAAATALWLGFDHLMTYLLYASLFGGAAHACCCSIPPDAAAALLAKQQWVERLHRMDGGVPYGIALAAAALAIYPETPWMTAIGGPEPQRARRFSAASADLARRRSRAPSAFSNRQRRRDATNH